MRHATNLLFVGAILFAGASVSASLYVGGAVATLVALSILFNLWLIRKSDTEGFVRAREMRRATEPPRRFTSAQTVLLVVLSMIEAGTGLYVLLL